MNKTQQALKERFAHLHPLLFERSLERARTDGELFDILEDIPADYPLVWDEELRRWVKPKDVLLGLDVKLQPSGVLAK